MRALNVCILFMLLRCSKCLPLVEDSGCTSNFDYMYKLLEKFVRFESAISKSEEKVQSNIGTVENQLQKFGDEIKAMSNKITDFIAKHEEKFSILERASSNMIADGNQTVLEMKNDVDTYLQSMDKRSAETMAELRDLAVKKDVVFQVKKIASQPTGNSVIKFSTVVTNTDNVYSLDTGCFVAPQAGTFWFAAQLCTNGGKNISPSIFINEVLVSSVYVYTPSNHDCETVTAVAVLKASDNVCLKAGLYPSSSSVWDDSNETYQINTFMGAMVN